ncbi:unnamed protein product [Penicillium roqueforti FM164]|uniref:Genomic scaffold, ProqFM164S02 n=1 Tax=Penicillium roqueforti (strain FM164) TaxID=1365484 RepID=W6Q427_PENRF|nr:unnamed protein product [Penicillium roqueforti FM164]
MSSQYEDGSTSCKASSRSLSIEGKILLNILAFFDPHAIPEWLLSNPKANITDPSLKFLSNDSRFGGALIDLTNASLIVRSPELEMITLDQITQSTVFSGLPKAELSIYLDSAIQLQKLLNLKQQKNKKQKEMTDAGIEPAIS